MNRTQARPSSPDGDRPTVPPLTDRRVAELHAMAVAECTRGAPEASAILRADELLAMCEAVMGERAAGETREVGAA